MQKQYTKEEMREYWEGKQAGYFNESKWRGFIECARFLGAMDVASKECDYQDGLKIAEEWRKLCEPTTDDKEHKQSKAAE
jgi:hypothetical protein